VLKAATSKVRSNTTVGKINPVFQEKPRRNTRDRKDPEENSGLMYASVPCTVNEVLKREVDQETPRLKLVKIRQM